MKKFVAVVVAIILLFQSQLAFTTSSEGEKEVSRLVLLHNVVMKNMGVSSLTEIKSDKTENRLSFSTGNSGYNCSFYLTEDRSKITSLSYTAYSSESSVEMMASIHVMYTFIANESMSDTFSEWLAATMAALVLGTEDSGDYSDDILDALLFRIDAGYGTTMYMGTLLLKGEKNHDSSSSTPSTSSMPFDNLKFSDFVYEKSKHSGNASISGRVKNENSYPVKGYFYVLFYKNGQLVHSELVSLPTIGAGSTGSWSDAIYDLDYDKIDYSDSNIRESK